MPGRGGGAFSARGGGGGGGIFRCDTGQNIKIVIFCQNVDVWNTCVRNTLPKRIFIAHIWCKKLQFLEGYCKHDENKHIVNKRTIYGQSKWSLKSIILDVHH